MAGMHTIKRIIFPSIVALSFLLTSCSDGKKQMKMPVFPVKTQLIKLKKIPLIKEYIGITKSVAEVGIRARVKGFLVLQDFTEGKEVNKDQLLFVIDPKPFKAKLAHAKAVLKSSIAERDYQAIEFVRMKKLVSQGNVAKVRYDKVNAQLKEAQAQVDLAKADVETAQINLDYCYMRSPIKGRIGEKMVDVGNLVGGTDQTLLANVVQLDPIYVEFSPSVSDFAEILKNIKNMPFNVTAVMPKDPDLKFTGKVDLINNQVNVATSTILMRASLDNPKHLLLPGIYVNVSMVLTTDSMQFLVPSSAVMDFQGQQIVYVLDKENKVEQRIITSSGQYQGQDIITKGLKEGDVLITSNLQKLHPGQTVKPEGDKQQEQQQPSKKKH